MPPAQRRETSSSGNQSRGRVLTQRSPRDQPLHGPRRPPLHPGTPKLATESPRRAPSPRKVVTPPPVEPQDAIQEVAYASSPPMEFEIEEERPTRVRRSSPKFRPRADSFGSEAGGVSPVDLASDKDALLDTDELMVSAAMTRVGTPKLGVSPREEMMDHERRYFRSTLPKKWVNPSGYCCRILFTLIWIAVSIIVSATIFTRSTQWFGELTCIRPAHIYDDVPGYSKVFAAWDVTGTHETLEGSKCRLWFQFDPTRDVGQTEMQQITDYSLQTGAQCGFYATNEFSGECADAHCWTCISSIPCSHVVGSDIAISDPPSPVSWTDLKFPPYIGSLSPIRLTMDDTHHISVDNAVVGLEPICSADGNVSPGHIVVIQGFIIAGLFMIILVTARESYLWWREIQEARKKAVDDSVMACHMHDVRREMRRRVEGRWEAEGVRYMVESQRHMESDEERRERKDGSMSPGARGFSADQDSPSGLKSNVHRHFEHGSILSHDPSPTAMFARAHSTSRYGTGAMNPLYRDRVGGWDVQVKNMRVGLEKRRRIALVRGLLKTILRAIFFLVVQILACLFVFVVSPRQLFEYSWWSILDAVRGIHQVGSSPWVFTDLLVLTDVGVLILMGIPSAIMAKWWPSVVVDSKPERMSSGEGARRAHEFSPIEDVPTQGSVVDPEVCVIIVIRSGSCADFAKRKRIAKLVRRCVNLFPSNVAGFSRVFVVDHGPGLVPADDCWKMLQDTVSPEINYAYLPEDDKAIAIHWANKFWIPSQVRRHCISSGTSKIHSFRYAMVIDQVDGVDDLLLPMSMDIDTKALAKSGSKVLWFPSTVRPTVQGQGQSVWVDDYFLKADAIVTMTQQKFGRSAVVVPSKSVCMWERKALLETLERLNGTDATCASGGELTQRMFITQMRLKGAASSTAAPQVRVTNHDQFGAHCKDWRLLCTLALEFFNPFVATAPRWIAKFSIALYHLIPAFFVVARPFYLGTLFLRAPIDIPILFLIYYVVLNPLSISEVCLALRRRPEIKRHWKRSLLFFAVPLYRLAYGIGYLYTGLFHAMFQMCFSSPSIRGREKKACGAGVPPLPGSSTVDWFSVWVCEEDLERRKNGKRKAVEIYKSGNFVWSASGREKKKF